MSPRYYCHKHKQLERHPRPLIAITGLDHEPQGMECVGLNCHDVPLWKTTERRKAELGVPIGKRRLRMRDRGRLSVDEAIAVSQFLAAKLAPRHPDRKLLESAHKKITQEIIRTRNRWKKNERDQRAAERDHFGQPHHGHDS